MGASRTGGCFVVIRNPDTDTDSNLSLESQYKSNSSLTEGCSGQLGINTSYENTSKSTVGNPRSGDDAPKILR